MRYVTADTVKARAPLDSLLAHLGHPVDDEGKAVCPFHDDTDPSLRLWMGDDGKERWHCFVCGVGGDQIDLLRRARGLTFSQAVVELDRIAEENDLAGASLVRAYRTRDPEADARALHLTVAEAMERAVRDEMQGYMSYYAVGFVSEADQHLRFDWDATLRGLGWGIDDLGRVVMPHWTAGGELTGAKLRSPDGTKAAVPGSRFPGLYLSWFGRTADRVLICEGETDSAWAMRQVVTGDVSYLDVRGCPSGQKVNDDLLDELLGWGEVFLAFDGDLAGDMATERWRNTLVLHPGRVRVVPIAEFTDLRSSNESLAELLSHAR